MHYTFSVSEDGNYVVSTMHGELTNENAKQHNIETHNLGKSMGIDRFLVDAVDCRYVQTPVQHYEFINSNEPMVEIMNRKARVAILVHPDDQSHDFFETVARNAGHDLTIFRDRESAIHHLIHDL